MKKSYKVTDKKHIIELTDKEYKAAGGQGVVFCKGNTAYKIYHDPINMIPVAKIEELNQLKKDNILAPISPLYDYSHNKLIGFTMKFVQDVEFLCKIFIKNFRDTKGISFTDIITLVTQMQETLQYIHSHGILVVDYNEMNFLLNKSIETVLHIDVDSWQTKNFPATVIMESIRDRKTPKGKFSELTDWFSWAVVTFQMYTGIHPYKGRHPDFKLNEWGKRMDEGVSVFDPKVTLPDSCQDFSVIPRSQLDWYKRVFVKNERSIPPRADEMVITAAVVKLIGSKGDFIVKLIKEVDKPIRNIFFLNRRRYIITSDDLYEDNKKILTLKKSVPTGMCEVFNESPLLVYFINGNVEFYDFAHNLVSTIQAEALIGHNDVIYTINNGRLIENTFERLGKIIHKTKIICEISRSYKVFKGVLVQDDFMKCRLVIPFDRDKCININIKELDKQRVIDARYDKGICIVITEKQGKYLRNTICFDKAHSGYTIQSEEIVDLYSVNFIVLPNKFCISVDDEKLSIFKDNTGRKEITNYPFDVSMRLYHEDMQVFFIDKNKLYSVIMK